MSAHVVTPVTTRPASGPGALAHFAADCSCGMVLASSLSARAAEREVEQHLAWAARWRTCPGCGQDTLSPNGTRCLACSNAAAVGRATGAGRR